MSLKLKNWSQLFEFPVKCLISCCFLFRSFLIPFQRGSISCRWHHRSQMIVCYIFSQLRIRFFNQNKTFFILEMFRHLKLSLHLIEPHWQSPSNPKGSKYNSFTPLEHNSNIKYYPTNSITIHSVVQLAQCKKAQCFLQIGLFICHLN